MSTRQHDLNCLPMKAACLTWSKWSACLLPISLKIMNKCLINCNHQQKSCLAYYRLYLPTKFHSMLERKVTKTTYGPHRIKLPSLCGFLSRNQLIPSHVPWYSPLASVIMLNCKTGARIIEERWHRASNLHVYFLVEKNKFSMRSPG